jgi:cation transport regulator ChaC
VEYLKELAEELRRLDVVDEHIELIYKHVQELEEQIKAFPGEPTN